MGKNIFKGFFLGCLVVVAVVSGLVPVSAEEVSMTQVAEYALSFNDNKNIPYVWGGGRGDTTLEELASKAAIEGHPNGGSCTKKGRCGKCMATGTDCSGFTSLVYKHFGINITAQSQSQYDEAKKRFTDMKDAVPGDICWWKGHVGIYIGDGKMIHTNSTMPPSNYPHVSILSKDKKGPEYYKYPTYFLRMVDDVSELKIMSGSAAKETYDKVQNTVGYGSIVTESDLTGLIIPETMIEGYGGLPEISQLSDEEMVVLEEIKTDIDNRRNGVYDILSTGVTFIGICVIFYGVLLGVAYLFDRSNNIFELSLLAILTLGRYRLWEDELGIKPGFCKRTGIMYCNSGNIIIRIAIIEAVGFFLVGGIGRFF